MLAASYRVVYPQGKIDRGWTVSIRQWPHAERPREKLETKGAAALSEAELLAIVLGSGTEGKSAVDLARDLLQQFGGLASLLNADLKRLQKIKGIGRAKSVALNAVIELLQRALREEIAERSNLSSPGAVRDYLRISLSRV